MRISNAVMGKKRRRRKCDVSAEWYRSMGTAVWTMIAIWMFIMVHCCNADFDDTVYSAVDQDQRHFKQNVLDVQDESILDSETRRSSQLAHRNQLSMENVRHSAEPKNGYVNLSNSVGIRRG